MGEPKIAFKQELMLRNEGRPRWRREDMRMAAMKTVLRTEDQKDSRKVKGDEKKARWDVAPGAIF